MKGIIESTHNKVGKDSGTLSVTVPPPEEV